MILFRVCFYCIIFLYAANGFAASFDCSKASTTIEKAICSDPALSRLDSDLGAAYISLRKSLTEEQFNQVKAEQRGWMKQRDEECQTANIDCLIRLTRSRLAELEEIKNPALKPSLCDTLQNRAVIDELYCQFEKTKPQDFSSDKKFSLIVSDDGTVVLHDLAKKSKTLLHKLEAKGCGSIGCMGSFQGARFAGNGRFAVTSSSFIGGPIIIWDTRTWKSVQELPGGFFCISGNSEYIAIMAHNWETGYELFLYSVVRDKLATLSGRDGIKIGGSTFWYRAKTPDFGFTKDAQWLIVTVGYNEYVSLSPETLSYTECSAKKDACKGEESKALIMKLEEIDKYYEETSSIGRIALNLYCKIKSSIETADHVAFAELIAYPIAASVAGKKTTLYSPEQFVDYAEKILNPSIINAVKETDFMDMFFNYQGFMFGNGQIWFNANGVIAINN